MMAIMEMGKDKKCITYNKMKELVTKIERLGNQMAQLMEAPRETNAKVTCILNHMATLMTMRSNNDNKHKKFTGSLLNNE